MDSWIEHSDGILLVYSIADKESFKAVEQCYQQVLRVRKVIPPMILVSETFFSNMEIVWKQV